jgi:hypothetical protein
MIVTARFLPSIFGLTGWKKSFVILSLSGFRQLKQPTERLITEELKLLNHLIVGCGRKKQKQTAEFFKN